MSSVNASDLIEFVERLSGGELKTIGGNRRFRARVGGKGLLFDIGGTEPREESLAYLEKSVEIFNRTGSLKTTDYTDTTRNSSYVLALIKAVVEAVRDDGSAQISITRFYQEVLGANLGNMRWSWGAYEPLNDRVFLRVWSNGIQQLGGREVVEVFDKGIDSKSLGFPERKAHLKAAKNGTECLGIVCEAVETEAKGGRRIRSFDRHQLLRLEDFFDEGDKTFGCITERVPVSELVCRRSDYSGISDDLPEILEDPEVGETEKVTLASARIGQGRFRREVLEKWGGRCAVTGIGIGSVIRASHIKPWRDSENHERLDPNNGLPLVAHLDALFDTGLITFGGDGKLLVSNMVGESDRAALGLSEEQSLRQIPERSMSAFLEFHCDHVFVRGDD